jgi:hypothetical protein
MKAGEQVLLLTPKGMEALRSREAKLDANARNILSLIEHGVTSVDAILQRSKSPRDEVIKGLRSLLSSRFVTAAASDGASARLTLKPGVSPSQARFALSNFCLDQFGTEGQNLADVVDLCSDVASLQEAVNDIRVEVDRRCPDKLPALAACVQEINETDF